MLHPIRTLRSLLAGLLLASLSQVQAYTFQTIDVPFSASTATYVSGVRPDGAVLGGYLDAGGKDQGFLLQGTVPTVLLNVTPQGMNSVGQIVGVGGVDCNAAKGFLYQDGTVTTIEFHIPGGSQGPDPAPLLTAATGITDSGIVVGYYRSGVDKQFYGFLYDSAAKVYTQLVIAGAASLGHLAINTAGVIVGFLQDAADQVHAFRIEGGVVTDFPVPSVAQPAVSGISDDGTIVGTDTAIQQGFVRQPDGTVTPLTVPLSTLTQVLGITPGGIIYGRYIDAGGTHHGFIATPGP